MNAPALGSIGARELDCFCSFGASNVQRRQLLALICAPLLVCVVQQVGILEKVENVTTVTNGERRRKLWAADACAKPSVMFNLEGVEVLNDTGKAQPALASVGNQCNFLSRQYGREGLITISQNVGTKNEAAVGKSLHLYQLFGSPEYRIFTNFHRRIWRYAISRGRYRYAPDAVGQPGTDPALFGQIKCSVSCTRIVFGSSKPLPPSVPSGST